MIIKFILVDKLPDNDLLQQNTFYISDKLCMSKHLCLCGCNKVILSVDDSPNQDLNFNNNNTITYNKKFYNKRLNCQSIYKITENIATIFKTKSYEYFNKTHFNE